MLAASAPLAGHDSFSAAQPHRLPSADTAQPRAASASSSAFAKPSASPPSSLAPRRRVAAAAASGFAPAALTEAGGGWSAVPSPAGARALPREAVDTLRRWLEAHKHHPYPTAEDKAALSEATGLTLHQVRVWFTNTRKRWLSAARCPDDDDDDDGGGGGDGGGSDHTLRRMKPRQCTPCPVNSAAALARAQAATASLPSPMPLPSSAPQTHSLGADAALLKAAERLGVEVGAGPTPTLLPASDATTGPASVAASASSSLAQVTNSDTPQPLPQDEHRVDTRALVGGYGAAMPPQASLRGLGSTTAAATASVGGAPSTAAMQLSLSADLPIAVPVGATASLACTGAAPSCRDHTPACCTSQQEPWMGTLQVVRTLVQSRLDDVDAALARVNTLLESVSNSL